MLRKFCQFSPFFNEWGMQSSKRVITSYTIFRQSVCLSFTPLKARFLSKETYYSLRGKGTLIVDFIPRETSLTDPNRKILLSKEKKGIALSPQQAVKIFQLKEDLSFNRQLDGESRVIKFSQTGKIELEIYSNHNLMTHKEVDTENQELYLMKRMIEYSIPYMMGWYGLGDQKAVEQNLYTEYTNKDPFESSDINQFSDYKK